MINVVLRRAACIPAALIVLAGILGPTMPQAAGADLLTREQIEQRLAESILRRVPAYEKSWRDRALAACINWEDATLDYLPVHHTFWCHTGEGSDIPVFISRLMNCALRECDSRKRGDDCECVPVAKNETLALEVPEAVFERLLRQRSLELVGCLLPRGELPVDTTPEACRASGGQVLSEQEARRLREEFSAGLVPQIGAETRLPSLPTPRRVMFAKTQPKSGRPVEPIGEISIDEALIYVVIDWGSALERGKDYLITYTIFDGAGKRKTALRYITKPTADSWRTWTGIMFDRHVDAPGNWTVEVRVDDQRVGEGQLTVLPPS